MKTKRKVLSANEKYNSVIFQNPLTILSKRFNKHDLPRPDQPRFPNGYLSSEKITVPQMNLLKYYSVIDIIASEYYFLIFGLWSFYITKATA